MGLAWFNNVHSTTSTYEEFHKRAAFRTRKHNDPTNAPSTTNLVGPMQEFRE